eukprot:scaffold266552_cov43-Prasinocladus_malaysianus.AAC.1
MRFLKEVVRGLEDDIHGGSPEVANKFGTEPLVSLLEKEVSPPAGSVAAQERARCQCVMQSSQQGRQHRYKRKA